MKKAILILVMGLLLSSNAYAKEIKVYHKDENSISMTKKPFGRSKTDAVAQNIVLSMVSSLFDLQTSTNMELQMKKEKQLTYTIAVKKNYPKVR